MTVFSFVFGSNLLVQLPGNDPVEHLTFALGQRGQAGGDALPLRNTGKQWRSTSR